MAEVILNAAGQSRFFASSAGNIPTGKVHPKSLETLKRHGLDPGTPRSKSWNESIDQHLDLVVTVCDRAAGETCPLFPARPRILHWSIPDPAQATGTEDEINSAFDNAFQLLKTRIETELLL